MMMVVHPLSDPHIYPKEHLRALCSRQRDPAGFFGCLMLVSSLDLAQVCFWYAEFVEAPDDKLGHFSVHTPKVQFPQRWLAPVA
jgi:hypothetical protein